MLVLSALPAVARDTNRFQTSAPEINSPSCLGVWRPHGAAAAWKCESGKLHAQSADAGLKATALPFADGVFTFDIAGRTVLSAKGRGETAVWLRNGTDGFGMRRLRVVIEENPSRQTGVRIEQFYEASGYQRLAAGWFDRYPGRYRIAVQGSLVLVETESGSLSAITDVVGEGITYLFSSGGEGARSSYDNFDLRDNEPYFGGGA